MKIAIIGLGYVGLVTALVLADSGNIVVGIDIDKEKIYSLKSGNLTIFEPGLDDLYKKVYNKILFSTDYQLIKDSDLVYLIVPTPTENGKINLKYIFDAAENVKKIDQNAKIVIKSTVVPGTANIVHEKTGLLIISNPEFTKEGTAVEDTKHPDRVIIGGTDNESIGIVEKLWSFTKAPIIKTTNENAELIKYASNSFLATKISFINELANLCEAVPNADVEVVAKGMGLDKRIAPYFLRAGIGYGGSCFPKDTRAIASFARSLGEPLSIVEATIAVNEKRVDRIFEIIKSLSSSGKEEKIGVLGISFKNDTNDVRESQALKLINKLTKESYKVNAYDPIINKIEGEATLMPTLDACINASDILVIATEWEQFKTIKTNKPIIDARRILDPSNPNVTAIGYRKNRTKTRA
ncbi:MAG: UDP-glucose/GDP-mannose dehydrogenase family protein [Candidatus Parvarchaeum sp.]